MAMLVRFVTGNRHTDFEFSTGFRSLIIRPDLYTVRVTVRKRYLKFAPNFFILAPTPLGELTAALQASGVPPTPRGILAWLRLWLAVRWGSTSERNGWLSDGLQQPLAGEWIVSTVKECVFYVFFKSKNETFYVFRSSISKKRKT